MQDILRERTTTELPPVRRKQKRFDPGWVLARAVCALFAFLGLVPIVLIFVVRSEWAHTWAARETELLASRQGIPARYDVDVKLWPLALDLTNVTVESSDRLVPAVTSHRVRLRPKVFALLSGKLAIDSIEIDDPSVRLVFKGGELQNLKVDLKKKDEGPKKPFEAPFNAVSVSNAELDLTIDDVYLGAHQVDLDVTAEHDDAGGSDLEIALRAENATSRWSRTTKDDENPQPAMDDDALCGVEGRVRVEPHAIIVRRFEAQGSIDLDVAPNTTPECDLPQDDKRRAEVALGHVTVRLPEKDGALPKIDGHVRARAPIGFAARLVNFPECDGWVAVDTDVRFDQEEATGKLDLKALDASGTVNATNVRLKQFNFAESVQTDFAMHQGVITAKATTIRTGDGVATLSNTTVEPLVPGGSLRSSLEIHDVNFTSLMRELGISPHPHVAWELRELHGPVLTGTFDPLKIDMDFVGKTGAFAVYDGPADAPAKNRVFGFSESLLQAHLGIRPDGVKFTGVHAQLPHSVLDNGYCSLGFHNDLRVDVPTGRVNLEDISPIGPVKMQGDLALKEAHVRGVFNRPEPEGDIASITNYVVNDMSFGNVAGGHVAVDVTKPEVVITKVHAQKNKSEYDVPTARLEFGKGKGFDIDAQAVSQGFDLRDLLQMFQLDDDPRFDQLNASIATHADIHVAVGGPEDKCGGGHIGVRAKSHLSQINVHGEAFASGDADIDFNWFDREQGIAGADVSLRSFVLAKGGGAGTVLGSAEIRRGGALDGHLVVDGVPLQKITNLGAAAGDMEGSVAAVAQLTGNLDDFRDDAGVTAQVDVTVSPVRVRGVPLGQSHFGVKVTRAMPKQTRQIRTTGCGAPVGAPFDKVASRADRSSHGDFVLDGDLFDGTVHATGLKMTWQDLPLITGQVSFRGFDLGAALKIATPKDQGAGEVKLGKGSTTNDVSGQLFGELTLERVATDDLSHAKARFELKPTTMTRGGQKLTIPHPDAPFVVENDTLTVPPLEIRVETPGGFSGGIKVGGTVTRLVEDPTLALEADIEPIDLSILPELVPQVDRASGRAEGKVLLTGKPRAPIVHGELHASADELAIHNAPGAFTDLKLDVSSDEQEIHATGKARFAGGTIGLTAVVPLKDGFTLGNVEAALKARGIHLTPAEGISAGLDADLTLAYDPHAAGDPTSQLPQVGGEVDVTSFDYTRPVSLTTDLSSSLGGKAKRTEIDTYDPSLNFIAIKDLRIFLKSPAKVKNNLVELGVTVDSGSLTVNGTNQRVGLSGSLRTLPGGHFRFLRNDFEIQQGLIRFDDPTRIDPNVDVTAVTEYRRYSDASTTAGAAGAGTAMGGALWRITVHAYGDADNLRFDLTSDPALAQEDIALLMTFGMTRAELDQMQASSVGAGIALNVLGATTGATSAVKEAIPVIDDFGFGSGTTRTGQTDPQVTVGKRLTDNVRATVTSGLSADRELRSNIEWRLTRRLSALGSYDNINDVSSSSVGNVGVDLRWRLEFQ